MDGTIGWADIQIEVFMKNIDSLIELMDEINNKFSGAIRKQTYWITTERHKERWLPEMEFKKKVMYQQMYLFTILCTPLPYRI